MLDNQITFDANVYTNLQGLDALKYDYKAHPKAVTKEVSQQFEALLLQMLLKSMREANKAFSSDVLHSDQSAMYEDLYDKQLALVLSKSGIGIAHTIENYIDRVPADPKSLADGMSLKNTPVFHELPPISHNPSPNPVSNDSFDLVKEAGIRFENTKDFVSTLWASAKEAARTIGVDPKLLLAQAALETNWGKNIIPQENGTSTHNLFNIKADSSWSKKSANFNTIEQKDNLLVKEKSKFSILSQSPGKCLSGSSD